MDYALYREESSQVKMYDRDGHRDDSIYFGARAYLNRIVIQYKYSSICDGGEQGSCMKHTTSPYEFAYAYDTTKKFNASDVTCDNVPFAPESWWAGFMAYPTFAAFIAPYDEIGAAQMSIWMDTFSSICNFTGVNLTDFAQGPEPTGDICLTSYFEASQAVIATLIMSDMLVPLASFLPPDDQIGKGIIVEDSDLEAMQSHRPSTTLSVGVLVLLASIALVPTGLRRCRLPAASPCYCAASDGCGRLGGARGGSDRGLVDAVQSSWRESSLE